MTHAPRTITVKGRTIKISHDKSPLHGMDQYHFYVDSSYFGYQATIGSLIERIRNLDGEIRERGATDYLIRQAIANGEKIGD